MQSHVHVTGFKDNIYLVLIDTIYTTKDCRPEVVYRDITMQRARTDVYNQLVPWSNIINTPSYRQPFS